MVVGARRSAGRLSTETHRRQRGAAGGLPGGAPAYGGATGGVEGEKEPGAIRGELFAGLDAAFAKAERVVRALDPACLAEPRAVGRRRLPTTAIGLPTHIAEHTQRHVGEAICAARLARAGVI